MVSDEIIKVGGTEFCPIIKKREGKTHHIPLPLITSYSQEEHVHNVRW